jgi:hypothetical protein
MFTTKSNVGVDWQFFGKIAIFILALLQSETDAMPVLIHERDFLYEMMIL